MTEPVDARNIRWTPVIGEEAIKPNAVRTRHIYLPDAPVDDEDAANKKYVDDQTFVPAAHNTTHENGGTDEISIAGLSGDSASMTTHKASSDHDTHNDTRYSATGHDHDTRYYTEAESNTTFAPIATAPTTDEKAALAGTDGTPAAANKYVTNSDARNTNARTPSPHALIDTTGHTATGLTTGHFLKATGATTYAFGAHGLTYSDVGAAATAAGVPVGAIIMWNSTVATIPANYQLCDGTNSTPDLRDKFIVGAKQDDSGTAKTNVTGSLTQTGGAATVALSETEMPAHDHDVSADISGSDGTHVHTINARIGAGSNRIDGSAASTGTLMQQQTNSGEGTHDHAITVTESSKGSGTAHENLPPYFALCFIQRMS